MFSLSLGDLTVQLIDPNSAEDRPRLGTRYCWGGYIWQVRDSKAGDLFTGPQYPEPNPTAFNGQGAPEALRWADRATGRHLHFEGRRGMILGIGEVALQEDGSPVVKQPCAWTVTPNATSYEFCTQQSFAGWAVQLQKSVSVQGRTVTSSTRVTNTGTRPLPLHWFAHPFFALTDRLITGEFPAGFGIADNPGFSLANRRFAMKERYATVFDGHFELLHLPQAPLDATFSHPRLKFVRFSVDFVAQEMPVWANNNTFSIEPYLITELAPGAIRSWSAKYEFGPMA